MLNTEDFIKRLEFIMEHFGLSASLFADKISVQRSSISHLLSGRNKPSLDFVMKVTDHFPELNLYWLLNGSDSYLKSESIEITSSNSKIAPTPILENNAEELNQSIAGENNNQIKSENLTTVGNSILVKSDEKRVHKIVLFYTDGTFQEYKQTT